MPLPRPPGHHSITPSIVVRGAAGFIDFLESAFDAAVVARYDMGEDKIAHAEVRIGDSSLMLGDSVPGFEPMPSMLTVYVDDVDVTYARALAAGASSITAPANQFYGHRSARVLDVWGNKWSIAAVVEEVSEQEIIRRMESMG